MNENRASASKRLLVASDVVAILFILGGAVAGVSIAWGFSEDLRSGILFLLIGLPLGALLGYVFSLPCCAILTGFAKIVAWYEAVPPGKVCILRPDAAPIPQPAQAMPSAQPYVGLWRCSCGKRHPASETRCEACGETLRK